MNLQCTRRNPQKRIGGTGSRWLSTPPVVFGQFKHWAYPTRHFGGGTTFSFPFVHISFSILPLCFPFYLLITRFFHPFCYQKPFNLPPIFSFPCPKQKSGYGISSFLVSKIWAKFHRGHPQPGRHTEVGVGFNRRFSTNISLHLRNGAR